MPLLLSAWAAPCGIQHAARGLKHETSTSISTLCKLGSQPVQQVWKPSHAVPGLLVGACKPPPLPPSLHSRAMLNTVYRSPSPPLPHVFIPLALRTEGCTLSIPCLHPLLAPFVCTHAHRCTGTRATCSLRSDPCAPFYISLLKRPAGLATHELQVCTHFTLPLQR